MLLCQIGPRVNSRSAKGSAHQLKLLTCDSGLAYCHQHRNAGRLKRDNRRSRPGTTNRAFLPRQ